MFRYVDSYGDIIKGTFTYKSYEEAFKGAARLAKIYGDYAGIEPDSHNRVGDYHNNVRFATRAYRKHRYRIVAIVFENGEYTHINM